MNLKGRLTIDELRELIKQADDHAGHHILWVKRNRDVELTRIPRDKTAKWFQHTHPDLLLRYEMFEIGHGYVGPEAVVDEEYLFKLYDSLRIISAMLGTREQDTPIEIDLEWVFHPAEEEAGFLSKGTPFTMPPSTLTLLVLKTHQQTRLQTFYTALGIAFTEEQHGDGPLHFAAHIGELVLEIYPLPADAGPADTTTRLGFSVPELDEKVRLLEVAGATVVSRPKATEWGYRAIVRDPDGRAVELTQVR
jgi:predicted enzyme related to lactoylglutathione lyase